MHAGQRLAQPPPRLLRRLLGEGRRAELLDLPSQVRPLAWPAAFFAWPVSMAHSFNALPSWWPI